MLTKSKTAIVTLLTLVLCIALLAGCAGAKTPAPSTAGTADEPTAAATTEPVQNQGTTSTTPGSELSNFISSYTDAKTKLWDAMTKQFDADGNTGYALSALGFAMADLALVEIPLYDGVAVNGGKLLLTDIPATRTDKGGTIEIGYDYTYTEDKGSSKKGDHLIAKGTFDKSGKLSYESSTQRDGKVASRTVLEVIKNSDTSFLARIITLNADDSVSHYIFRIDGSNMEAIEAAKAGAGAGFTYDSILGRGSISAKDVAAGLEIKSTFTYKDGKATNE